MKKLFLFFVFALCSIFTNAQIRNIYVSIHGGKILSDSVKLGYNKTRYTFGLTCDTIICSDPGYEMCEIPNSNLNLNGKVGMSSSMFNEAISEAMLKVRKANKKSGEFYLLCDKKRLFVKYNNADDTGEADFLIEVI